MKGNKYIINNNYVEMIIESKVYGIIRVKIDNDFYKSFEKLLPEVKNKLGII